MANRAYHFPNRRPTVLKVGDRIVVPTDKGINQTVPAPRLKLSDVQGRALVIHEGGDNYSDNPENGGGKGRVACGVVPKQ